MCFQHCAPKATVNTIRTKIVNNRSTAASTGNFVFPAKSSNFSTFVGFLELHAVIAGKISQLGTQAVVRRV
jgi:hypothetical protein